MNKEAEYSCSVTLMILGEELDPTEVSKTLRMRPSQAWRKGEPKTKAKDSIHSWGGWKRFLPESKKKQPLEVQLAYWCKALHNRRAPLIKLAKSNLRCVLSCFVGTASTASVVLKPALQRAIVQLGLTVELTVWASANESDR